MTTRTTNQSRDRCYLHVEDVPTSFGAGSRAENQVSPPLSPSSRPLQSVVPPNSPDPLWRCCARFSKMDLDDDDDDNNNSGTGCGLRRADLSYLQDHNPLLSASPIIGGFLLGNNDTFTGGSMTRRVSDDFAPTANENSTEIINSPSLPQDQKNNQQLHASTSCSGTERNNLTRHGGWESGWDNFTVRDIPVIYFIEPSTSVLLNVTMHPPKVVTKRIAECLRCLSVQARFFSDPAAAALLTLEHVEMYLVLWIKSNQLVVEIQRRRGDSSVFLRYTRLILSAAQGQFNAAMQEDRVRKASLKTDWQETLKSAEMVLKQACPSMPNSLDNKASLAALAEDSPSRSVAVIALVSNLISKDDSDARHLGMETACILTDPRRTGISTAVMMSRVVVLGILPGEEGERLGDVCKHIHLALLMLIMTRCFPGNNTNSSNSSNSGSMLFSDMLEMDDDNECFFSDDEHPTEHSDFTSRMFHQALQVLANSLEVLANFENFGETESTSPERFLQDLVEAFVTHANRLVPNGGNLVRTLLEECQMAEQQPHNAYLATKILKYLCGASAVLVNAVLQEKGWADLTHAHQVGKKTHICLELEAEQLLVQLSNRTRGV